ncbi:MAG TPA: protein kinase [Thermoanaerobaculia bacterium]|nr:protein kinase [Thermoanaerobaculia bacterium]
MRSSAWTRLALLLGFLKLGGVVGGFLLLGVPIGAGPPSTVGLSPLFTCAAILAFGGAAIFLVAAGRGDPRAVSFGGFLLFAADSFCNRPAHLLQAYGSGALADLGWAFGGLRLDILMPLFFWRFVRDFPQAPIAARLRRLVDAGIRASLVTALAFLTFYAVHALLMAVGGPGTGSAVGAALDAVGWQRDKPLNDVYGTCQFLLLGAALPVLAYKARLTAGEQRRRVRLFASCLLFGLGPVVLYLLAYLLDPAFAEYQQKNLDIGRPMAITAMLFALSIPFSTSYVVLVHRVLELKLVARRALQYALARYSAVALATVPLATVLLYLYQNRSRSLIQLFSGGRTILLLGASGLGMAALSYRRGLLDWVDRRFFREQYDARQILTMLVERVRAIRDAAELAKLIAREADLALHLDGISLLIADPRTGMLKDPIDRARRLDGSSALSGLISSGSDPLSVDLDDARSPVARLPEKDRHWLAESGFRLLVPILSRDGSLLGIVGLGEKKSGLPFLKEDRQLLHAIASNAAWVLELDQSRTATPWTSASRQPALADVVPSEPLPVTEVAKECSACGILYQPFTVFCGTCSRRLEPARVPFVLPGKFRFERRIGYGGMGVVYGGSDLALGRPVAVKTLRRVSPEDAMRLRREARTAAAVSHPHLASIYGIETWQGVPMLILEFLEGGTLAQRIERERLSQLAAVDLGIAVAEGLARLHSVDILHRDIKPSNIGFTRDGIPKLMDFGIARVMFDLRRDSRSDDAGSTDDALAVLPPTSIWNQTVTSVDLSRQLAGTLSYLSPEALNGQRADASFDLWSLAIVLYECLLGHKVFGTGDVRKIMTRIRLGRVPDFAQVCPEHDETLGDFFRTALHKSATRRPATALELKQLLVEVRARLLGGLRGV